MPSRGRPLASPLAGEAESRQRPVEGAHATSPDGPALPSSSGAASAAPTFGSEPADRLSRRTGENEKLVLLGEFGRAHGLKGEVRLKSFTQDPRAIARYGPLQTDDGRRFVLQTVRPAGGGSPDLLIARVEGVTTREAAEALNRIRLFAPRERLPGTEADDEFLLADLIGGVVRDREGRALGTVVGVPNYGGGDLLEIAPAAGGATALLPFTEAFVPEVHVAGGYVVVDAPDLFAGARADEDV